MENKTFIEQTAVSCLAALLTSPGANKYSVEQIAAVAVSAARALERELAKPPFIPQDQEPNSRPGPSAGFIAKPLPLPAVERK